VSATRELEPSLERLLASLLYYGTWLASAVIAAGLVVALFGGHSWTMRIVTAGILLLIMLPVVRVTLMLIVFVRDWTPIPAVRLNPEPDVVVPREREQAHGRSDSCRTR
jgi:uncharacterized membrane protein